MQMISLCKKEQIRASAMLLILWVWQNLKRAFTPSTCYICCSMLQVTETGCEVLTARLPSSPDVFPWLKKPWWGTASTATRKWYWYTGSAKNLFTLHQLVKAEIFKFSRPESDKHATAEQSQQLSILWNYFWECVLLNRFSPSYTRRLASWDVSPIWLCNQSLLLISENIISINLSV